MARPRLQRRSRLGLRQVIRHDVARLQARLSPLLDRPLAAIFAFTLDASTRRLILVVVGYLFTWVVLALLAHPIPLTVDGILFRLPPALLAPDVLRRMLVIALTIWLTSRMAAIYLDDVFDLNDYGVAARFLRAAAFGLSYNSLTIQNAEIPPDVLRRSPIIRIGGPGWVNVHMENAALFEKVDGTPHVVSATTRRHEILDGFERYREVIDLRDQVIELSRVDGRTLDGIPIAAKDVKFVFSVYRGELRPRPSEEFPQPYPFVPEAIQNLVYRQRKAAVLPLAMKSAIEAELRDFIAQHKLSEFLANVDAAPPAFYPREEVSNLFYDFARVFTQRAPERGTQLQWIGVGTWETPSEIVPRRHLDAWNKSSEARSAASAKALKKAAKDARLKEHLRLVNDLLITAASLESLGQPADKILVELAKLYRARLVDAIQYYRNNDWPVPPALQTAHEHILRKTSRWV